MKEYTSILIPTDFSGCATKAMEYGLDLAKRFNSSVHILYVVEPLDTIATINGVEQSVYIDLVKEVHDSASDKLTHMEGDLKAQGYNVHCLVREGRPAEVITEYAKQNNVSLICISTHGRSGLNHLLLGSTTEKVLRKAECPVFVVRSKDGN